MVLCGASIIGFTVSVLLDVVTRTIGHPWLWLQQVTTGFFAYGVFVGMAAATRRNDHLYLTEITRRLSGGVRTAFEAFARLVVLAVAVAMVWFGYKNFLLDLGSFRMPSMIPLGVYTISVPVSRFGPMETVPVSTRNCSDEPPVDPTVNGVGLADPSGCGSVPGSFG